MTEERGVEFKRIQEAMDRMEETIIAIKRKNAGANARNNLMEKAAQNNQSSLMQGVGGGDNEDFGGLK